MTSLLVDIGNSRVKWTLLEGDRIDTTHQAVHHGEGESVARVLQDALDRKPDDLIVANVAGRRFTEALAEAAAAAGGPRPRFVVSASTQCGVRNAYRDPARLGVDRWAAIIASYTRSRSSSGAVPSCIIGAGTAVTFDAVREDGQHLGGLILAGPTLQAEALAARTSDIGNVPVAASSRAEGLNLLGRTTETAVAHGAWLAISSALSRAVEIVEDATPSKPIVYLHGGYAEQLRAWLRFAVEVRENLVLEGLAAISKAKD